MFGLLTRRPRPSVRAPRRTQLTVERLETRYCPAPVITSFTATVTSGKSVTLTGTLTDGNPSSVSVAFSGVMSGSTTADANGNFSYTANATGLGTVSAVGTDAQQLTSNTAQAQVAAAKPSLTLYYSIVTQTKVVLTGTVTAGTAGGLTVSFTGVVSGSTITKSDGTYLTTLNASGLGQVQATVTDVWGQVSDPASVTVTQAPPSIVSFQANRNSGTTWTFSGTITDLTAAGDTVTFSGLPSLQGKTATTQSDGTFSLVVTLRQGEDGTAAAICTDWFNLTSPQKLTVVAY
jgi:hypothetical protein